MNAEISVIIPVYKAEKYIRRCVESILNQTYTTFELLLIDDGSPDHSGEICDELAQKDSRIRVIHQKNGGVAAARNRGVAEAAGEFISFVDADDCCSPFYLEQMYKSLMESEADLAIADFVSFTDEWEVPEKQKAPKQHILTAEETLWKMRSGEGMRYTAPWGKLYKTSLFQNVQYPEGRISEDEATTYKLIHASKQIVVIDESLYGYFMENENSITSGWKYLLNMDLFTAYEEQEHFFAEHGYNELAEASHMTYLNAAKYRYQVCYLLRKKNGTQILKEYKQLYRKKMKNSFYRVNGMGYKLFYWMPYFYAALFHGRVHEEKIDLWTKEG